MKTVDITLQTLLQGTQQFIVPLFQRPYHWEEREWERLWRDLCSVYAREGVVTHFLGSIILAPLAVREGCVFGVTQFLVVDGQHRLTTLFVLLCALRDYAHTGDLERKGPFMNEIQGRWLTNVYEKDLDFFKLLPTQRDRPAFFE